MPNNTTTARIDLVRRFLHNPTAFPDGLHAFPGEGEQWFSGHENYWIPLAITAQRNLDASRLPSPKRSPLVPPQTQDQGPLTTTTTFLANADHFLKNPPTFKRTKPKTAAAHTPPWATPLNLPASKPETKSETKPPETKLQDETKLQTETKLPSETKVGRPSISGKPMTPSERTKRRRAALKSTTSIPPPPKTKK